MESHRGRDWANLMPEILSLVARRLNALDYASFSAVCASWAWIATPANGMPPPLSLRKPRPFLLLRPDKDPDRSESCRTLLDALDDGRRYEMDPLPEMDRKWVAGSQFGWLAIAHIDPSPLFLFNPFTRARINLPPITAADRSLRSPLQSCKVVLSSNPSGGNFMAVAMFGHHDLALFRTGQKSWSFWDNYDRIRIDDVICWEGKAVAVTLEGDTYEIELSHSLGNTVAAHRLILSAPHRTPDLSLYPSRSMAKLLSSCRDYSAQWLVKSPSGALLRVSRDSYYRVKVQILAKTWVPIRRFPGMALLVSATCSMPIPASTKTGIKENCVYLTDRIEVFDISCRSPPPWPPLLPKIRNNGDVWITSPYFDAN